MDLSAADTPLKLGWRQFLFSVFSADFWLGSVGTANVATASSTPASRTRTSSLAHGSLILLTLALLGYLAVPLLTPPHFEGFTAIVASAASHLQQDTIANLDRSQPLNVEFYGLTKLGWVLLTAGISFAFGIGTTAAMKLLVWIAAPTFLIGSAYLVRRWTGLPLLAITFILILLPGATESSFFFNDNLVASALVVGSFCALYARSAGFGAAACGVLFGAAVLTRTDTILLAPAIPLILLERPAVLRSKLLLLLLAAAAGSVTLCSALAWFHTTPLDLVRLGAETMQVWNRPTSSGYVLTLILYFLGPLGAILALCGLVPLAQGRDIQAVARLGLPPAVFLFILWDRLWEIRQILPLTPFFASLCALALRDLCSTPRARISAILHGALVGILLFSLFGPRTAPILKDGPRVLAGRVANIHHWRKWQDKMRADLRLLEDLAAIPPGQSRVIVVDYWNEDRLAHLALLQAGYRIAPVQGVACPALAERFTKSSREIYLVRLQQSHVPYQDQITGERLSRWGAPCIAEIRPHDAFFVTGEIRFLRLFEPSTADAHIEAMQSQNGSHHWPFRAVKLDFAVLEALSRGYDRQAAELLKGGEEPGTIEQGAFATRRRTKFGD
jgi:hypothetical protein